MSISENTTKINQLITKINDLPSAAPTVRRVESSFVVTYDEEGATYVDCGFKPDVVVLLFSTGDDGAEGEPTVYAYQCAVVFSETRNIQCDWFYDIGMLTSVEDRWRQYEVFIKQTENGFTLANFCYIPLSDNSEWVYPVGEVYNYVAIKYT